MGVNVLSLFNGMCFGRMALEDLEIEVDNYYSCEIDKYANKATKVLYPEIPQIGDINDWKSWDINLSSIDLILAGFPCTSWSNAGKQEGDNDPRGALVHTLIEVWNAVKEVNPDVKFLFENVRMKQVFMDYIDDLFGEEHVEINSALVSAQNRNRIYWSNVEDVGQPEDRGILLKDILEYGVDKSYYANPSLQGPPYDRKQLNINYKSQANTIHDLNGKCGTLCAGTHGYSNGHILQPYSGAIRGRYIANKGTIVGRRLNSKGKREDYNKDLKIVQCLEVRKTNTDKSNCLTTVQKDNVISILLPGRYEDVYNTLTEGLHYRKLTVRECMRLQTVPEDKIDKLLASGISNSQLYKMTGNGWTLEVIKHLLKGLK